MEHKTLNSLKGLKICFIAGTLGVGGAERQLYLIISALMRMGANVSVICLNTGEYWEKVIKETGIKYYTLKGKGAKMSRLFKIIFILAKIKPNFVQSHHYYTNLYAAIAGRFLNIKSVGSSRSDLEIEIKANGIYGIPSLRWPHFFIFNSMKSFNLSLVSGRDRLSTYYLPNALDTIKFNSDFKKPKPNSDNFVLLAMGRLDNPKRFDKYIELIAMLKRKYSKKIKGILIGSGALENYLKQYSQDAGLDQNDIEFISHTSEPETFLKKADIFVLTSDFEGTPNVILEAMACGLPVISTKVGNLPNIIRNGENGFFFDGSVDDLFKVALNVMDQTEIRNMVSKNAIQTISDCFSIKVLEKNLISIYRSVLN